MMELYIETLTGTAFELRVSPFETIMSVKAKIQRLEGIPISQQHLIWQSMELEDDYCLHDYSIHDGATLKLVLAMRGGPINTRRIAMEDPALREMAEYMEANREEILDKFPGNRQVTLLVYREGDQLNFFRVVDRGDGTLTPLSESLSPLHFSGTSMYNLYDDEEDDEPATREAVAENVKTKEKMDLLRSKMENLTITKKPKKKPQVRPPSSGRPTSRTRSSAHRLGSSAGHASRQPIGALAKNPLPPLGPAHNPSASGNQNPEPPSGRTSASSVFSFTNGAETPSDVVTPMPGRRLGIETLESAKLRRPLSSVKEDSSALNLANKTLHSKASPAEPTASSSSSDNDKLLDSTTLVSDKLVDQGKNSTPEADDLPSLPPPPPLPPSSLKDKGASSSSFETPQLKTKLSHSLSNSSQHKDCPDDLAAAAAATSIETRTMELPASWLSTGHASYSSRNSRSRDTVSHPISMRPPTSSNKGLERILDHGGYESGLGRPLTSASSRRSKDLTLENLVRPPTSKYSLERKQGLMLESLSQSEARGLLRQASIERLGSSKLANFVRSASKSRTSYNMSSGNPIEGSRVSTPEGRLVSARLQQRVSATRDRVSPGSRLPPVKQKKKASKRCFVCTKKTGLATSYQCRCGNNFCATHRYAEAHDCTFDYKTEGRKLLEQANPVVNAPKLPKI